MGRGVLVLGFVLLLVGLAYGAGSDIDVKNISAENINATTFTTKNLTVEKLTVGGSGLSRISEGLVVNDKQGALYNSSFRVHTATKADAFVVDPVTNTVNISIPVRLPAIQSGSVLCVNSANMLSVCSFNSSSGECNCQ